MRLKRSMTSASGVFDSITAKGSGFGASGTGADRSCSRFAHCSICARIRVYKGRARRLTPEQIEQARQRVEAGVPVARVAREAGVSRQTLYDTVKGRGAYSTPSEVV